MQQRITRYSQSSRDADERLVAVLKPGLSQTSGPAKYFLAMDLTKNYALLRTFSV